MSTPSTTVRRRSFAARVLAVLLLSRQALVIALPSFETRTSSDQQTVHVEAPGTRHAEFHNDATCLLCSARNLLTAVPLPESPLIVATTETPPATSTLLAATPADIHLGTRSRAPPALI